MHERKKQMLELMKYFDGMPDRLLKYMEILLLGKDASPHCYQDTMSYRRLAVAVTTYCNLNCKWCYRLDPKFKDILNKEMDIEVLKKIVNNTKGRFRMIHLAGTGEPFIYGKLPEAVRTVRKLTDNVKITTNSTLVTKENISELIEAGLTHIEFSVDGFTMESLTEYRGVDLNKLVEVIEFVSADTPLDIQINSVVSSLNLEMLMNLVETLKNAENIKLIHTIPLFMTKQLRGTDIRKVTDLEYKTLLLKIESDIKKYGLNWETSPSSAGVGFDPIIELKRKHNICFTCFEDPYIDTEGWITDCGRREFHKLADASKGFEVAFNSEAAIKYRQDMLDGNYPDYCGGFCYLKEKK